MNVSRRAWCALRVSAGLLMAQPAAAECPESGGLMLAGDELNLTMSGKMPGSDQTILVIPVVDSSYPYDPAQRQFAGSEFETVAEDLLDTEDGPYAVVSAYWLEASYGNVQLQTVIPNCFYQVSGVFPTTGEEEFQRASLLSASASGASGITYDSFTLSYLSDPSEGQKSITFVSDGSVLTEAEDLLLDLQEQLGTAADELEIEVVDGESLGSFRLLFQITEQRTFDGSSVTLDKAASDPATRKALGLVEPTLSQPMDGEVIITTDGADLDMGSSFSGAGEQLLFKFAGPMSAYNEFRWQWIGEQPCGGVSSPACETWSNAAELSPFLVPTVPGTGTITDTTVSGLAELALHMQVDPGETFDQFSINEGLGTSDPLLETFLARLGLASVERKEGTGSFGVTYNSRGFAADALESFLTQELTGPDAGCIAAELPNFPADLKQVADDFLRQFSAIHVYVLSAGDIGRENASRGVLCTDVNVGGTPVTYQVVSPVALVELSSPASTIVHETGHNIGFPDLYDNSNTWYPEVGSDYHPDLTYPGEWDVMAGHLDLSHPSSFTKQFQHGWLNEPGVTDNGSIATVTPGSGDQTFLLTPLERPRATYDDLLGPQTLPVVKMIVLPFGNVTSSNTHVPAHFLAVENRQEGVQFSQALPWRQDDIPGFLFGGVRVSDNIADLGLNGAFIKPIARNYSHSLVEGPPYPELGGSTIEAGSSLDTLATFPSYPGVTIENIGMAPGPGPDPENEPPSFMVRVVYTATETVDLSIKPWLAPDQYATNAIWFEPATSITPPTAPVIPDQVSTDPTAVGNVNPPIWLADYTGEIPLNWIHVQVDNAGTYNVENVRVKATFNSPGGAGDASTWEPIVPEAFSEPKSIPAGGSAVFSIPWNPDEALAADGHTCVAVEVVDWTVQGGLGHVADINPFNNVSQENIHSMVMKSQSPWQDVPFRFEVHNDYDHDLPVELEPVNMRPGYQLAMARSTAVLSPHTSHTFEGTFSWDPSVILTPPSQDPNDPYWQACNGDGSLESSVYDAEDMYHSVGHPNEGPGWILDDNGFVSVDHGFVAGPTTITVLAAGRPSEGEWPHMTVSVDGIVVGDTNVEGGFIEAYSFDFDATAGTQELRVSFDNDYNTDDEDRALFLSDVVVDSVAPPPQCGGIWGLTAWGILGDYRVPLGGSSFAAEAKPVGDITTTTTVATNGNVTVSGSVEPPYGGQDVRIYIRYPSGRVDIIEVVTESGGGYTTTFEPHERGTLEVSTELPRGGGPYAPTDPVETTVEACIPATCSDGVKNQGETGVDCGGPCAPCAVPACSVATATDLGVPGASTTVPIGGCVRVQNGYPSWWGTRTMRLETAGGGTYPVPFTWSNSCSGSSGSGTFTANWQAKQLVTTNKSCATLIDLHGTGSGNVTLKYWGG